MKEPGAIARASMKLYGGGAAESKPTKKRSTKLAERNIDRAIKGGIEWMRAPSGAEPIRWRVRDLVLVAFGHGGDQIAQIVEFVGVDGAKIRKWSARAGRWTSPILMPIQRLLGRPAKDDPRRLDVRAALAAEKNPRRRRRGRSATQSRKR